jgi:hypothetical protein
MFPTSGIPRITRPDSSVSSASTEGERLPLEAARLPEICSLLRAPTREAETPGRPRTYWMARALNEDPAWSAALCMASTPSFTRGQTSER